MEKPVEQILCHCKEKISDVSKYLYMTRAIEFQEAAISQLDELEIECDKLRNKAIEQEQEDSANALLSILHIARMFKNEFRMWVDLKKDKTSEAWEDLIKSQMDCHNAVLSHEVGKQVEKRADYLDFLEKILFPPLQFASVGFITKKTRCSICGFNYEECTHIKGKPYMGNLCAEIIEEAELQEVSLVDEPANKMCRILAFEEKGIKRDVLTWREVI